MIFRMEKRDERSQTWKLTALHIKLVLDASQMEEAAICSVYLINCPPLLDTPTLVALCSESAKTMEVPSHM